MRFFKKQLFFWTLLFIATNSISQNDYMKQWPQFRGPFATGIIDSTDLPESWNVETGDNIKWKIDIPGLGHSCPVIWNDKLFITTAISSSGTGALKVGLYGNIDSDNDTSVHEFKLYCINKNTGDIIWEKLSNKGVPGTKRHTKASHASCTPATNGKYVIAFFGSDGLFCYDMNGELIWEKNFGRMNAGPYDSPNTEWGFASSPIVHENKVIVQCDFIGESFIASFDIETGKELWRTSRDEISTWSTPNFYNKGDNKQIVVNGWKHMGGYDFETGKETWKMSGGGDAPVPVPIIAHDLIYIHNAHGKYSPIYAIRPNAKGDITLGKEETSNEYIKWSIKRGAAYMPTDLVYGDYLYNLRMNGVLTCFDAKTGEKIYTERIPEARGITASGIASDGKLYYSTEQGDVFIVKAGSQFEVLAKNSLNDIIMATPAISENILYFRTQFNLIAVGK